MFKAYAIILTFTSLLISISTPAEAQVNKCVVNGTTTFQREPCPTGQIKPAPTAEQLNREQKKRSDTASAAPVRVGETKARAEVIAPAAARFGCDKRKYCSQMTSCAEAKFFLANCPGVKMDGDRDGIPCEEQWCKQ
jgi:Excalibur calcium-binding domain